MNNNQPKLMTDILGTKRWRLNGLYHREDGPAIEHKNGDKSWWFNGKLHRENGPAIECISGHKEWIIHGKSHRVDGPAIICSNDKKEWYLNDKNYSEVEWFQLLTPEQQYNYLWNLDE